MARDILSLCDLGDDTLIGFMKRIELVHLVELKAFFCSYLPSLTHPVLVMIRHQSMTTAFYIERSFPVLASLFEPEKDKEKPLFQLAPHVQFMHISRIQHSIAVSSKFVNIRTAVNSKNDMMSLQVRDFT